ncbi:MAG: fumarate hydratase [Candidatus Omnitrophica bacterium]|jgi:fumarate hydratase subunit alpha|nr:fumarate hydratase [Candidatus Omnitrophota bacterium]
MKTIKAEKISAAVKELCIKANFVLRKDVLKLLRRALVLEKGPRARRILEAIIKNAGIADKHRLAICQDTGMPCVFVELGQGVMIKGDLNAAINKGVMAGYRAGSFRNSIIKDPILRGKPAYAPAVIHVDIVKGDKLRLTVLPKGFGSENKSRLRMFNPTASLKQIKGFVVDAVKAAGPDACPPYVVGVGIGGTADMAAVLAKKALLRDISVSRGKLAKELLNEINKLRIGPMGLGGKATALAVSIETYPTHIAGLPVAVNISCHATRSAAAVL